MMISLIALAAGLAVAAQPALAQTEPAAAPTPSVADSSRSGTLDEIVVTAQKRSQSVNDVGLSITTLNAAAIERRGISDALDLVKVVPGLSVANAGNGATVVYTLRGIGFNSSNLGATSAVAVYVDEIPLPYPIMTQGVGLDLERVEAYKGPQGTLFGQNSTGGAINYIAKKPTDHLSGGVEASYGRFNAWNVKGQISGPLSDTLRVRVAVSHDGGGAWQKSRSRPDDSLGDRDRTAGRLLLLWEPTADIRINLGANAWRDHSDSQALQLVQYDALVKPGPTRVTDVYGPGSGYTPPHDARTAEWDADKKFQYRTRFLQPFLRADFDITPGLTVTSISTYSDYKTDSLIDADGMTFEDGEIRQYGTIKDFSQELRLSGKSDRFHWVVGGNYQKNTIHENLDILIHDLSNVQNIGGSGFGAIISPVTTTQKTDAKAIFANADYKFNDQFSVVVGARYTDTKIKFRGCNLDSGPPIPNEPQPGVTASLRGFFNILYGILSGNAGANPIGEGDCITLDNVIRNGASAPTYLPTDSPSQLKEHNFSWNVTANYKPNRDTLLYVRIAQGYKSGSFPTVGASASIQYLPAKQEGLRAYEAGFKLTLADRRVQLDGAGFYYDYKNKQLSNFVPDAVFGPLVAIVNVPKSRVYGAELAATVAPLDGLTVGGAVTYINTKILRFQGYDVTGALADLKGKQFNLAPKLSASADANYSFPLSEKLTGSVGGGLTYRSKTSGVIGAAGPYADDYDIKAYTTVDAQLSVESASGWLVRIWGKNIFNTYYWTNVNRVSDTIVRPAAMPATYGFTVGYKF